MNRLGISEHVARKMRKEETMSLDNELIPLPEIYEKYSVRIAYDLDHSGPTEVTSYEAQLKQALLMLG